MRLDFADAEAHRLSAQRAFHQGFYQPSNPVADRAGCRRPVSVLTSLRAPPIVATEATRHAALRGQGTILQDRQRGCATTTTFWACRRTRALTRSSARTGSWPAAITPTSRATIAVRRSSKCRARTTCCAIRTGGARTTRAAHSRGSRADWLADEVAIDFPSVSSVLDRMRDSFFGGRAARPPVGGDRPDARRRRSGARSCRSHVPLRRTCPRCGGRGEVWSEWCPPCGGGGEVSPTHEMRLRVPAGVREGARVPVQRRRRRGAPARRSSKSASASAESRRPSHRARRTSCAPSAPARRPAARLGRASACCWASRRCCSRSARSRSAWQRRRRPAWPPASRPARSWCSRWRSWPAAPSTSGPGARCAGSEPTGRIATLWLAVLNLFVLPFGTALGIYAFWVLLHNETRGGLRGESRARWKTAVSDLSDTEQDGKRARPQRGGGAVATRSAGSPASCFLLTEPHNRFVRFHAMQSTLVFGAACARLRALRQSIPIPRHADRRLHRHSACPRSLWLLLMFKAYQGERFKLPIAGDMAEQRI